MKEIWEPVFGYEGLYEVSNFGNMRSCNRTVYNTAKRMNVKLKGKPMKLILRGTNNYYCVNLSKNGSASMKDVHRLVSEAFIPNPNYLTEVNHIDGNKLNNNVSNLEWVTPQGNMIHAVYTGLYCPHYGIKAVVCLNTGKIYPSISVAASDIGIDDSAISKVCRGEWHHTKGLKFKYA